MKLKSVFSSCAGLSIVAFSSMIGASAMAAPSLDLETRTRIADVSAATLNGHTNVTEEQMQAWVESKTDLWAHLFEKPLTAEALPVFSLDSRPLGPALVNGVNGDGDAVRLVAFEVTPIQIDDKSIDVAVGLDLASEFKRSKAEAEMVFGYLVTDRGARAVIGVSTTYRDAGGFLETSFVPMVVASRAASTVCPVEEGLLADALGGAIIDIRNGGTWGYCRCVGQVLKCELYTAGCIASVPACVAACAKVCVGTLGLGCVACYIACAAGVVSLCEAAYDCWVTASSKGCV